MNNPWEMDDESFNRLLAWLDPEPEQAGKKYEEIRRKLIRIFAARGCPVAEELADKTIDRVGKKVAELAADYVGDPALYFFGVAHKVFLEWRRKSMRPASPPPPPAPDSAEKKEREDQCLSQCMATLPQAQRRLLLEYYREEKQAKINRRKALAVELGQTDNALKIKVFRLRASLQDCLLQCLAQTAA